MMYAHLDICKDPKRYRSYRAIEDWVIRRLMIDGNCYMRRERFYDVRKDYEILFGKNNINTREDGNCIIVEINAKAKEKAFNLVYY